MSGFPKYNVAEFLGLSPVASVTDQELWSQLVTPVVKAILGRITHYGSPTLMESVSGHFPGDEATNLNNHLLYGGQPGFVRFPYISTFHRTEYGAFVTKRDGLKVKAYCLFGPDVEKGKGEMVLIAGLRDRRYDGTARANDCSLLHFPYDHPVYHRLLHPDLSSCEISIYSFMPGSRITDATGEPEFEEFIERPFTFVDRPQKFLEYFHRAWKTRHAPGQKAAAIPDVSRLVLKAFERLARRCGYDLLEAAPSHYHVARWFQAAGYRYSFQQDARTMDSFAQGLESIRRAGYPLTRPQQSWVCVVQSLPVEHIPSHLHLPGLIWPQDNIGPRSLWLNKPLTARASQIVPGPLSE